MLKTKLYRAVSTLSRVELNRLSKFIDGELPPISVSMLKLLIGWCKMDDPIRPKDEVWKTLLLEGSYDDLKFRKICTDGMQILARFLSVEQYYSDPLQESTTRLMALGRKDLEPLYRTQLNRVETLIQRMPEQGADYYYHRYRVEQHKYQMKQANLQRFKVTNIEQILQDLDTFYIIEKLRYYCEILSRKTFVKHLYENRLIDEILEIVSQGVLLEVPVVQIYYQIVLTHLNPNENEYYYQLKEAVSSKSQYLPVAHRKEVFDSILNYCNRKINQGHKEFLRESFDHYQAVLKNELIYIDGQITHWTFKNVVVLALRLGEFDWAESFILRFSERIEPVFRDNAVKYNLAQLYFYNKDYSRVLTLLQEVEYADVSYNMGAKTMLLATYFELKEFAALKALGESFRVFLNRRKNTIPELRRRSYLNLISFTLKLANIADFDRRSIKRLLNKMDEIEVIASEHWIREKLMEKLNHPIKSAR